MLTEEKVRVTEILEKSNDIIRIKTSGGCGKALLYRSLCPDVEVGDVVIVNTTAGNLRLGTGGWDIVRYVMNKHIEEKDISKEDGHIMKARYLSDQHSVLSVEAPESIDHELFQQPIHLNGRNILIGELHSMLPIVWFLLKILKEEQSSLAVIFSDEASLPLIMSKHVSYLHKQSSFYSITTGQAFGGKADAVNVVTGLQYAVKKYPIDTPILITLGPGVVGSNTHYGYSGLSQANWANYIGALGGKPVWIPRLSEYESRERHRGISHHTLTPLKELTLTESILPLPSGEYSDSLVSNGIDLIKNQSHIYIKQISEYKLFPLLERVQNLSPFPLSTMGRTIDKDPLFFLGVAAAVCWLLESERCHSSTK
ncbi:MULTISPECIES: DUF3866 family protein [Bacillaceae]|uniref:DUF3866 family protein n=1 Tax=Bacillaceae TaxID=186817 RepID=UPI001F3F97F6|nr:DUF3866 family protein [Litchfieldia alkalitelluris]